MIIRRFMLVIVLMATLVALPGAAGQTAGPTEPALDVCRFAITAPYSPVGYPLDTLGIGSYLDWYANSSPVLPSGVEHVRVLRVSDAAYNSTLANLPAWLQAFPGSTWLVGNEPDTSYWQDNVTAEVYAARFFALATIIRRDDSTARIGFGTIVQPTPIRLAYLDRAWARLIKSDLAGSDAAASALFDVWSIHSFILNEDPLQWGTGIPLGMSDQALLAEKIIYYSDTYSITKFKDRIEDFRVWMAGKGERSKPLWITEYGSLFPPIDDPTGANYVNVGDLSTASFMQDTFDYLLTAKSADYGMTADGDRLVQRWFWYSLNDYRYNFGGSLFDPANNRQRTPVGNSFIYYTPPVDSSNAFLKSDLLVDETSVAGILPLWPPAGPSAVNYKIRVQVRTAANANIPAKGRVTLSENGQPVAQADTYQVQRCGSSQFVSLAWNNVQPGVDHTLTIRVETLDREDLNLVNNQVTVVIPGSDLGLPNPVFLPNINR